MKKALFTTVISILLFFSCDPMDYFGGYRGTNLIASSGFGSGNWIRAIEDDNYFRFEDASADAGDTSALPDGAIVYRLEIPNLFPNGDFESTADGALPAQWARSDVSNPDTAQVIADPEYPINGNVFYMDINNPDSRVEAALHSVLTDSLSAEGLYTFRFDYRTQLKMACSYTAHDLGHQYREIYLPFGGPAGASPNTGEEYTPNVFPPQTMLAEQEVSLEVPVATNTDYWFSFGLFGGTDDSGEAQDTYIDNFQVFRTDLDYWLELHLTTDNLSEEPVISGNYRFRVYVKDDPTSGTNNRFTANEVTLSIFGNGGASGTKTIREVFNREESWSDWTEIVVDLPKAQLTESDTETVLLLRIAPGDQENTLNMRPGSILIADPSLELFPDGLPEE
ncbi:MAG: hypothetical protein ACLFR1_13040 [Spirochaetia bacterium]